MQQIVPDTENRICIPNLTAGADPYAVFTASDGRTAPITVPLTVAINSGLWAVLTYQEGSIYGGTAIMCDWPGQYSVSVYWDADELAFTDLAYASPRA